MMITKEERDEAVRAKKKAGVANSEIMREYKISYATLRSILDNKEEQYGHTC